ncbi:MAG: DNA primase [Propionibacteriaceae bacterium]|jgi:DNA primase|nr:DNA primase [Propionibacteriaceae bacterium]
MPGRILHDDIEEVRNRARIDDVVSGWVTLRRAGAGTLQGLCPFHEEKTPSFNVTPARGLFYCFGCGQGGDVFTFVREINNLTFSEAVEFLANKYGVQLRYEDSGGPQVPAGQRVRLLEANAAAAEFFAAALNSPEADPGRRFLLGRGFDQDAAQRFGVGFAPRDGKALSRHLTSRGFSADDLVTFGLARRGGWDYFQSRLVWPIRDAGGAVLGFGARKLFDDDRLPAKYVNTPETLVYKKSGVLYGLDLARANIGRQARAVIVEGYTDVMACHLAGVTTAVASCGTAFGDDHARLIQRLMGGDAFHGEVVFTFDGDAAGQKAALRVFSGDAHFAAQTYVAVEPSGLDPCDLRLQQGDAALRELVARREPLYRFVMRNVLGQYDLDRVDGRLAAVREAGGLMKSIRDRSLVDGYVRELASLVGMDVEEVRRAIGSAVPARGAGRAQAARSDGSGPSRGAPTGVVPGVGGGPGGGSGGAQSGVQGGAAPDDGALVSAIPLPAPDDRHLVVERDALRLMLQRPDLFAGAEPWLGIGPDCFTHPAYAAVFAAVAATPGQGGSGWAQRVLAGLPAGLREWAIQLAVDPVLADVTPRHAREYAAKLQLLSAERSIAQLKSTMQRTNPVTDEGSYKAMFQTMITLELRRKELLQVTTGE